MLPLPGGVMHSGDVSQAQDQPLATLQASAPDTCKDSLRRQFRRLRREALTGSSPGLRAMTVAQLPSLLPPGAWLGLYLPVGSEPDLDPWAPGGLAEHLGQRRVAADPTGPVAAGGSGSGALVDTLQARLALPAVLPPKSGEAHGRLIYLPWLPGAPLRPDACGIPAPLPADGREPLPLSPRDLGLLLVPALAVDRTGLRLGSGGGWYDRLRADPAWRSVPALAVLPAACVVDRLPRDPWDVPFSGWLDEHGVWGVDGPEAAPLAERLPS